MLLFLVDLINIKIFRISFNFFYSFYFILRSRVTSVWYQSLISIRDRIIFICFTFLIRFFSLSLLCFSLSILISSSFRISLSTFDPSQAKSNTSNPILKVEEILLIPTSHIVGAKHETAHSNILKTPPSVETEIDGSESSVESFVF